MARTSYSSRVVVRERYSWPLTQLNIWTIVVLAAGTTILGIFADFISIQNKLRLPQPWLFPYGVTVGSLTVVFVFIEVYLIAQRPLLPGVMLLLSFILLVLYITGIVETAVQLFGPGNVSDNCSRYVFDISISGVSPDTLTWLEQDNICNCWYAAFSFWIIGSVLFLWMLIMAYQVATGLYE